MSDSKFYHFSGNGLFYGVKTLNEAFSALGEGGFVWLDFYKPLKEDLAPLTETLGFHPLSIEDCLDENQVPKIEYFPTNTFIIFNAFSYSDRQIIIDEVNLCIGQNFLITVSGHHSENRNPLAGIEGIISNDTVNAKGGPDFLMHVILDHIVDQKFVAFEELELELEAAEDGVLDHPSSFNPSELMQLRKSLLHLRKSLFHEREILVKICRLDCPFVSDKAVVHFRDIYDHLVKLFEFTETYREIVTSLMELYTSLLNNLMTRASNETNASVRRLTLIMTVFMPLTLLAGIGGMSEWSMMTGPSNWKIAYPLFILGMVTIGVANYLLIRKLENRENSLIGEKFGSYGAFR
jgi:magnesium transporter